MKQDSWNHRSEMEEHDSRKSRSITEEVDTRRNGIVHVPDPSSRQEDEGESFDDPADKWAAEFPHLHD